MIGGRWLIREEAIDTWFDSRRAPTQPVATPASQRRVASERAATARPGRRGSVARLKAIEGRSG